MSFKEQLYFLINGLLNNEYNIKDFCDEFSRIFNLEIDYDDLSEQEYDYFSNLSSIAARFSDDEEDLKLPNVFFDENQIIEETKKVKKILQ